MRIITAVRKIAVPFLQELGFSLSESNRQGHFFHNSNNTRNIYIDWNIFVPGFLRTNYSYINSYYGNYSGVQMESLSPEMRMGIEVFPSSPDQVEETIHNIMKISKEKVLPYVDYIADNEVFFTYDMYQMLAENTQEKAVSFAQKYGLDFSHSKQNALAVENIILTLRGEDRYQRKNRYMIYKNEIIELVAYWGEVIRRSNGGGNDCKWQWGNLNDYNEMKHILAENSSDLGPKINLEAYRPVFEIYSEGYSSGLIGMLLRVWNWYPEQYWDPNKRGLTFVND